MPNRIVREAILTSEAVASLGWAEEVFYRRLMSIVDDYGRTEAGLQLLRAKCYPLQTDAVRTADIAKWMAACQKCGLVVAYEVGGKQYVEVQKFGQQQRSTSKFPPPPASDSKCYQVPANAHLGVSVFVSEDEGEKTRKRVGPTRPEDVTQATWDDWLALRRSKKAPVTDTVLKGARSEAQKAGMALEAFLQVWCTRGSQGLQADWLRPEERPSRGIPVQQAPRRYDDAEETRRRLDAAHANTAPPSAEIKARIASVLAGKVMQ